MEKSKERTEKSLEGREIKKEVTVKVRIEAIYGVFPEEKEDEFLEWVFNKGLQLGAGRHSEYYCYSDNHCDDVPVDFVTFINEY